MTPCLTPQIIRVPDDPYSDTPAARFYVLVEVAEADAVTGRPYTLFKEDVRIPWPDRNNAGVIAAAFAKAFRRISFSALALALTKAGPAIYAHPLGKPAEGGPE